MRGPRTTLGVTCTCNLLLGMLSGALGPLLPQLAARLGMPVEALGALFPALFAGALATQLGGSWIAERFGLRALVLAGTALLTLGMAGLTVSPTLPLLLASAGLAGLGQGAIDVGANVLVAAAFPPGRVVTAVNLLHFAFGAGATLSPVVGAAALARWGTPWAALQLSAAVGLGTLLLGGHFLLDPVVAAERDGKPAAAGLYRVPALWLLALLLFLYVGGEMGVGGWTTVFLGRTTSLPASAIALVASAYWLCLTAGRLLGAALGVRLSAAALLATSVAGALVGSLLVLLGGGGAVPSIVGTLLVGLCYGPIFPTGVVLATERFPGGASRAVGFVVAVSSLGGMLLPPLQGVLLERIGPPASAGLVGLGAVGMLAALLGVRRGGPPGAAGRPRAAG